MPIESGTQIGPYFIDRELGRGAMGVVYLARDPRLNRDVAIKALPDHLAEDPSRLERFQSEAKALAQLNHPSVAGIHGLEEKDGQQFLIIEYVDGETLTERLERSAPSVDEAIALGIRIAAGIEAAHEAGVIHRDLKPDNILITPGDEVKILDFGLAKINQETSSSSGTMATVTSVQHNPTLPGVVLGTAAYMSPEQARGRAVDKRTDVWSFGVVLYECLTGASPFAGETASDSIGAVLHKDIDLKLLPAKTPTAVRWVLQRCLARDRNKRYRDIGDVRLELEMSDRDTGGVAASRSGSRLPLIVMAVLAAVAIAGWTFTALRSTPEVPAAESVRLSIALPTGLEISGPIDISRDGKTVVFAARDDDEQRIFLRDLAGFELREVSHSRDGLNPVFSPDGKSILFQAQNNLFRASVAGGPPVRLTKAKWLTADWSEDDTIVFSEGLNSPLVSMPASGGERTPITDLASNGAYAHVWPQRIKGTTKMLLTSWNAESGGGGHIFDLETGELRPLEINTQGRNFGQPARWSASGHLIFEAFGNVLFAIPFDPNSEASVARSEARPLLEGVANTGNSTRSIFALSDEGTLVYAPGMSGGGRLVWVDPDGTVEHILDQDEIDGTRLGGNLTFSPDGRKVVIGGGGDLAVVDLTRKLSRRIAGEANDLGAVWSPNGDRIYYSSNRDKRWSIWSVETEGTNEPELILQRDENTYVNAVAPNGDILFYEIRLGFGSDLLILEPSSDIRPLATTPGNEGNGSFSVDGKWVAYSSDTSGRVEVYLTRADGTGTPVQVSTNGGDEPKFGRSGNTLYFRRHRTVLRVGFHDGGLVGDAVEVFPGQNLSRESYDINADETRMVAVQLDDEAILTELRVITNFFEVIKEVAGPGGKR